MKLKAKVRLRFKPQDLWVGVYWDTSYSGDLTRKFCNIYICVLPTLPIHVRLQWRIKESQARRELKLT